MGSWVPDEGYSGAVTQMHADLFEESSDPGRRITPLTRREIFDYIRTEGGPWWGRLDETEFLSRIARPTKVKLPRHSSGNVSEPAHVFPNLVPAAWTSHAQGRIAQETCWAASRAKSLNLVSLRPLIHFLGFEENARGPAHGVAQPVTHGDLAVLCPPGRTASRPAG
jgi:hypothetical protein